MNCILETNNIKLKKGKTHTHTYTQKRVQSEYVKRSGRKPKQKIMALLEVESTMLLDDTVALVIKIKKTLFYVRVTNCPGLPRPVPALVLKFLHPMKPLSPRQTRTTGHPSCKDYS